MKRPGYTLLELLVVLMLLGAVSALAAPFIRMRQSPAEASANQLQQAMQWTFTQAGARGEEARFVMDVANRTYWVGSAASWPREIWRSAQLDSRAEYEAGRDLIDLRIGPDGSCDPVHVVISDERESFSVTIDSDRLQPRLEFAGLRAR